jgi:hypothetical protein
MQALASLEPAQVFAEHLSEVRLAAWACGRRCRRVGSQGYLHVAGPKRVR